MRSVCFSGVDEVLGQVEPSALVAAAAGAGMVGEGVLSVTLAVVPATATVAAAEARTRMRAAAALAQVVAGLVGVETLGAGEGLLSVSLAVASAAAMEAAAAQELAARCTRNTRMTRALGGGRGWWPFSTASIAASVICTASASVSSAPGEPQSGMDELLRTLRTLLITEYIKLLYYYCGRKVELYSTLVAAA